MSLGSFFDSIFTPPGTNARQGQINNQSQAAGYVGDLLPGAESYASQLQGFNASQLPQMENAVEGLGQFTSQAGRNNMSNAYDQWANGQAQSQAAQAQAKFGGNPAVANAYALGAQNNANTSGAQYNAQINSPQGEEQAYNGYLQGMNALNPSSADANVDNLARTVYGQPQVPVGQGLGGFIGNVLGQYSGGLFGSH